jgi:hypothetical protein
MGGASIDARMTVHAWLQSNNHRFLRPGMIARLKQTWLPLTRTSVDEINHKFGILEQASHDKEFTPAISAHN